MGMSASRPQPVVIEAKKRWVKPELTKNGNPVRHKMHVKTGDKVVVISGKDKGTITTVTKIFTKKSQILCEDVNLSTRFFKAKSEEEMGYTEQRESPIHSSNVMHWSDKEQVRSRIKKVVKDNGKKVRVLVKTGEELAN
mmetsp:Transcript_38294/g.46184  ORF Transcript_38294/g.46184 Transcript_38294/m.46184 type:complete len:139 (+) Transcript_38294:3-419(+)